MNETKIPNEQISNLKKVTLNYSAGTRNGLDDLVPEFSTLDFIFGIGSEGLTPFEYEIVDRNEGDTITLSLSSDALCNTFEHLQLPELEIPEGQDQVYLKFEVVKVAPADNREVIKAMAEINACGGSGLCDCCGKFGHC